MRWVISGSWEEVELCFKIFEMEGDFNGEGSEDGDSWKGFLWGLVFYAVSLGLFLGLVVWVTLKL